MNIDKDGQRELLDEEKFVLVEDEANDDEKKVEADDEGGDDEETGDRRLSADQRDEEDDGDIEERKLRRREAKRRAREKKRRVLDENQEVIAILTQQNKALTDRLSQVEDRFKVDDAQNIDWHIRKAADDIQRAEAAHKNAIENLDGDTAVRAQRLRDDAMSRLQQARNAKQQMEHQARQQSQQAVDPRVQNFGGAWMKNNSDWFDPSGRDEDSAIALAIDRAMTEEGKDPRTKEYWAELSRRVRRRIPHVFEGEDDDDDGQQDRQTRRSTGSDRADKGGRGGPPVGGRGDTSSVSSNRKSGAGNKVYINAERKQALMDLGVWGDEEAMKPFLRKYAEYDKANNTR